MHSVLIDQGMVSARGHGVLKVRGGVIVEVGIASGTLTGSTTADRRFFRSLRAL